MTAETTRPPRDDRSNDTDVERIGAFLVVTFLFSWSIGAVVVAVTTLDLVGGVVGGVATGLLTVVYMWGPGVGHVVARTVTGEGWTADDRGDGILSHLPRPDTYLRPRIREGWPYYLAGWLLPAALTFLGVGCYFLVFPGQFEALDPVRESLAGAPNAGQQPAWLTAELLVGIVLVSSLTVAIPINAIGAFGEEFGWRAYLLPKLLSLGPRRGLVVLGVVWGVWHWPLTAIGHNYGLEYPFAPVPGMIVMLWFTTIVGVVLAWLTLRSGSVWPPVIAHAALNAIAGVGMYFTSADPVLLLGPTPAGLIGSIPFAVLAAWILLDEERIRPAFAADGGDDGDPGGATPAAFVDAPGGAGSAAAVPDEDGDG